MADIAAFRGILYNPARVNVQRVLAPPYDVIDEAGRDALAEQDPHNCVRLILPKGDASLPDSQYAQARETLGLWQCQGVLARDDAPAVYRYHQTFRHDDLGADAVTRRGFICAVRLCDYSERVILRHERTLRGPKVDRFKLWQGTSCHLSQIFALYSDPAFVVDSLFQPFLEDAPDFDVTTNDGTRHTLWRVTDAKTIHGVSEALRDKQLYIADGHHRYETMLALRNHIQREAEEAQVPVGPRSTARFGMMFLANVDDPGLVVLPTHRIVHSLAGFDPKRLLVRLKEYFDVRCLTLGAKDSAYVRDELKAASRMTMGVVFSGSEDVYIATLKESTDLEALGISGTVTTKLDVAILHRLVLERMLQIDEEAQAKQTNIDYAKDLQSALQACSAGRGQVCFLLNATPVSQVVKVSDADLVMPQKSTFFYPKIASGLVFYPIIRDESL